MATVMLPVSISPTRKQPRKSGFTLALCCTSTREKLSADSRRQHKPQAFFNGIS